MRLKTKQLAFAVALAFLAACQAGEQPQKLGFGAPASSQGGPRYTAGTGIDITGNVISATSTGSPSLTVVGAAGPSTLNVSTEGAIDWVAPGRVTTQLRADGTPGNVHGLIGGALLDSFWWVSGGNGGTTSLATVAAVTPALTSTAGNDRATTVLSSEATQTFISTNTATGVGIGCSVRVPAVTTSRVMRVYTNQYSADITATATLTASDGTTTTANATRTAASGATNPSMFTITYASGPGDGWLKVTVLTSANHHDGSNVTNMSCSAITVAAS